MHTYIHTEIKLYKYQFGDIQHGRTENEQGKVKLYQISGRPDFPRSDRKQTHEGRYPELGRRRAGRVFHDGGRPGNAQEQAEAGRQSSARRAWHWEKCLRKTLISLDF